MSLQLAGVRYRYPGGAQIGPLDLHVAAGEIALLAGPTGAGKSTLLRVAAGLLPRHGRGDFEGVVRVGGEELGRGASRVAQVGFVAQEIADQAVHDEVGEEVALSLEALGWALPARRARALEVLQMVGLSVSLGHPVGALSLGQRQRLALAGALAAAPRLLVLDEPLSQVDPEGAAQLGALLREIAATGVAILWAEHRLDRALALADRLVLLGEGGIAWEGHAALAPRAQLLAAGVEAALPRGERARLGGHTPCWRAPALSWRWSVEKTLDFPALVIGEGERVALVGPNGAGKSTWLSLLAGELGSFQADKLGYVPQEPDLTLFCATVREELEYAPRERGLSASVVAEVSARLGLEALLASPPPALSRGQRQRVAVGAALTALPTVLLLDEPTSGQDAQSVWALMDAIDAVSPRSALLFATHDLDLARARADRLLYVGKYGGVEEIALDKGVDFPPDRRSTADAAPEGIPSGESGAPSARLGLVAVAAGGVIALALERPWGLLALGALAGALLLASPLGRRWGWRVAALLLAAAWSTVLSQGLFYAMEPRVALLSWGPLVLYREGLAHGAVAAVRLGALSLMGLALVAHTSRPALVAALASLGVPRAAAWLATAALHFLPDMAREIGVVRRARSRRGRPLWRRSPWRWIKEETRLLRPVLARLLRRARTLGESLEARGFDPNAHVEPTPWRAGERVGVALLATLASLVLAARLAYWAYTQDLAWWPRLTPLYAFVRDWL